MNNRPSPAGRPTACMRAALFAAASTATTLNQSPIKFPPVAAPHNMVVYPADYVFLGAFLLKTTKQNKKSSNKQSNDFEKNMLQLLHTCYSTNIITESFFQLFFLSFKSNSHFYYLF